MFCTETNGLLSRLLIKPVCTLIFAFTVSAVVVGQSTEQNSPTPISTNEISGRIRARDLGDARVTTYYFAFNADRGDVFLNVVTRNFSGDIDIFSVEGLEPRTKIAIYADAVINETGRVIYMRKPERLLLRIQGRTPNDDPADFQIKFAGSFRPVEGIAGNGGENLPAVENKERGPVRVNSVGTIIEDPVADRKDEERDAPNLDSDKVKVNDTDDEQKKNSDDVLPADATREIPSTFDPRKKPAGRPRVIIDDPFEDAKPAAETETKDITVEFKQKSEKPSAIVTIERVADDPPEEIDPATEAKLKAAALSKINLVIILKTGKKFEKRMSKVSSFNVFDGVLKVVAIDGEVTRFSILDVSKITIE